MTANIPGSGLWGLGSGDIDRTDVVDGSNERPWSTDQVYVERLMCPQFFFSQSSIFVGSGPEKVPQVKYLRKFSETFNKQGLKENLSLHCLKLKKKIFFF